MSSCSWTGRVVDGAGGASKAMHLLGVRSRELTAACGYVPYPGTLGLTLDRAFDFTLPHLDVMLADYPEAPARLYPVRVDGHDGHVIRVPGRHIRASRVGIIAPIRLRDVVGERVTLEAT